MMLDVQKTARQLVHHGKSMMTAPQEPGAPLLLVGPKGVRSRHVPVEPRVAKTNRAPGQRFALPRR